MIPILLLTSDFWLGVINWKNAKQKVGASRWEIVELNEVVKILLQCTSSL